MKLDQLAFSTNAFKQTSLEDAIRTIAGIGYGGVEIMADAPHMRPDTFSSADARHLRRVVEDLGLRVSNVNAFTGFCFPDGDTYHPTWVEPQAADRRRRVDHTLRAIELTAEIGGDHISLQPAGPYMGRDIDELYDLYAEGLSQCLQQARSCGVTLGVEPEPGLLIERSDQFMRLKDGYFADEPLVQMNSDLGHFYCVREDPAEVLRRRREVIRHVHLEDITAERVHQHLVPGEGAMDFTGIFQALDEIGYGGWVTVELYPYTSTAADVARRAFEHLQPMMDGAESSG
ncbi:MAG: sugar phosphate isomerase/epimerase [Phycisphaerae bacterium]|nr:sugar phosphate isomerase/epimerase [Phycisphaerae bacterium]